MIDDWVGSLRAPAAAVVIAALMLWAFNVHEDRQNLQQLRLQVARTCATQQDPVACATNVQKAIDRVKP